MSQDEEPGLLSKVVKFVRNPTMNWADLDQPELDKESHYSKQMLKEMIERKRRNDFVRRREFDQLRKLRQREALTGTANPDAAGRPSFFQSSMPSKPDDRAGTLKKIDEIEAQMSQQWWKSKGETQPAAPSDGAPTSIDAVDSSVPSAEGSHHYATTVNASLPAHLSESSAYAPTDVSPLEPMRGRQEFEEPANEDMMASFDADKLGRDWRTPQPPAEEQVADFEHDPELEEASMRFANGDTPGAETSLIALLGDQNGPQASLEVWMTLFDLYRATGQHDRFDTVAIEFATRFGRSAPIWFSIPDLAGTKGAAQPAGGAAAFTWTCPSALGAAQVLSLQSSLLAKKPPVAHLNWTHLATIQDTALDPFAKLLTAWSQQKICLQFVGSAHLDELIKNITRSGDPAVNPAWWRLRMELLRIMQWPDEFDLVALDYCVTYEVSPPSWQQVACEFVIADPAWEGSSHGESIVAEITPDSVFADSHVGGGNTTMPQDNRAQHVAVGALSGLVLGDAAEALAPFEEQVQPAGLLVISCEQLVRIDFGAAGSVLNWAATQQASGRRVQFRDMHRLTAIFFNVIGVGEHAKIIPRRN